MSTVVLMALSAFVRIPVPGTPVPVTLQTFVVLLSGALLGRRLGPVCQAFYVALGSIGLPIFTGAVGGFFLSLPTGGYLLGFPGAAVVLGVLLDTDRGRSRLAVLGAMVLASALIYLLGAAHLARVMSLTPQRALESGVLPFLIGDGIKLLAAAELYRHLAPRVRVRLEL